VLLHELMHLRRGDPRAHLVVELVRALLWFHPAVWYMAARVREERERACDEGVLAAGVRPVDYATHLVDLVRALRTPASPTLVPCPGHSVVGAPELEARLGAVLAAHAAPAGLSTGGAAALAAAGLVLVGALAPLRVVAPPAPSAAAPGAPSERSLADEPPGGSPGSFRSGYFGPL
jgi:beta-lactamase regulating signal transducer with metallopeptidase domain